MKYRKKLIEVALPLEAINIACAREKSIRHGHPSTLHLWWARRPLAAARAVIFAQMVDDPSEHPELFPSQEEQNCERQRLFRLIEQLVLWENSNNQELLTEAHQEIKKYWRITCADNADHPRASELFDPDKLPAFHDPFAGGGALPLEAQRLGLESYASDLNPVAVLINKAMIEIPPKFSGQPPVNAEAHQSNLLFKKEWKGASGLADDVSYYGQWMRNEAEKRIGHLYPQVEVTEDMAEERPDLRGMVGQKLTVIAWLWARTVKSPNPAFASVDVPLVSSFWLCKKKGKETWVEPVKDEDGMDYSFHVRVGGKPDLEETVNRKGGVCVLSGSPIPFEYIRTEGKAGRMGNRLMTIVVDGPKGRLYLSPTKDVENIARISIPKGAAEVDLPKKALGFRIQEYGMQQWKDLFTPRQLVALTTFSDLVQEARTKVLEDGIKAGLVDDGVGIDAGGSGARAYADAVAVYLAFAIDKGANYWSSLCSWNGGRETITSTFGRQALPMVWDYAEANPFSNSSGNFLSSISQSSQFLNTLFPISYSTACQADAQSQSISEFKVISTDPPYYDNIGYADLSDFFYVWLRRSLGQQFSALFATITVPKADELIATPYRHGGKEAAEHFFMNGMTQAMHNLAEKCHPAFPVTIYYAFKQSETNKDQKTSSTGWETFLEAVQRSGFSITGTWPLRTEYTGNLKKSVSALASSVVLVCEERPETAPTLTRREFLKELKAELPLAFQHLQRGNIAPVDLQQAAIGPGMSVFTRYDKVINADGTPVSVREAMAMINQILDETLSEQEGDFDAETRWALTWFEQFGFEEGEFGIAETLSKAKNTSVSAMVDAGIAISKAGKVRLMQPAELTQSWSTGENERLIAWEIVHHLLRALETGEIAAAEIVARLGTRADLARDLAYRLFSLCERKKRAHEAIGYNALVQSWPELQRLAQKEPNKSAEIQHVLFE